MRELAVLRSRRIDLYPTALADARLAHQMNPDHADALRILAGVEAGIGEPESAIEHALQVLRLNPRDPRSHITYGLLSFASFATRRYSEGVAWALRALGNMRGMIQAQKCLVVCLVGPGEIDRTKLAFGSLQEMPRTTRKATWKACRCTAGRTIASAPGRSESPQRGNPRAMRLLTLRAHKVRNFPVILP